MTRKFRPPSRRLPKRISGCRLDTVEDGQGGALVTVHDIPIEGIDLYGRRIHGSGFILPTRIRMRMSIRISSGMI